MDAELMNLRARVEAVERLLADLRARVRRSEGNKYGTLKQRVTEVMTDGVFRSVNDIATLANLDPSAVRMVLYTGKERFERLAESPRRIRWRLRDAGRNA